MYSTSHVVVGLFYLVSKMMIMFYDELMERQEFHVHKVSGMISLGYSMVCFNT